MEEELFNELQDSIKECGEILRLRARIAALEQQVKERDAEAKKWRATCLQEASNHGAAEADAERLAAEYESTLKEIGGVWWEDPYEKSSALIAHKERMEKVRIYRIVINDFPYMGIDPNNTYSDSSGDTFSSNSFHTNRQSLEKLRLGSMQEKPKSIVGDISLKSELEKIIRRSQAGVFQIYTIKITSEDCISREQSND